MARSAPSPTSSAALIPSHDSPLEPYGTPTNPPVAGRLAPMTHVEQRHLTTNQRGNPAADPGRQPVTFDKHFALKPPPASCRRNAWCTRISTRDLAPHTLMESLVLGAREKTDERIDAGCCSRTNSRCAACTEVTIDYLVRPEPWRGRTEWRQ